EAVTLPFSRPDSLPTTTNRPLEPVSAVRTDSRHAVRPRPGGATPPVHRADTAALATRPEASVDREPSIRPGCRKETPMHRRRIVLTGGVAFGLVAALAAQGAPAIAHTRHAPSKHVLVLSVDGMHQADLTWYVQQHPHSALA